MLSAELQELKILLEKTGFAPYVVQPEDRSRSIQSWLEECGKSQLLFEKEKDSLVGAASFEPLPFDTDLYGIPMAKVGFLEAEGNYDLAKKRFDALLQQMDQICHKNGIQHLSARALPEQTALIHALEENGFYMVAGLSTIALHLKKFQWPEEKNSVKVRNFTDNDLEPLSEISRVSFGNPQDWLDKAHADPNLSKEKSDELYVRWFRNCCNGTQANQVLVAEVDGKPVGYITLKLENGGLKNCGVRLGNVPLNAVDPNYRQKGIYSSLVLAGLKWFAPHVDWVTIKTQVTTLAVQKTWQRLGAHVARVEYAFHKYYGGGSGLHISQNGDNFF